MSSEWSIVSMCGAFRAALLLRGETLHIRGAT